MVDYHKHQKVWVKFINNELSPKSLFFFIIGGIFTTIVNLSQYGWFLVA